MSYCHIKKCIRKYYGRGYCHPHYQQWHKYGQILPRTRNDKNEIFDKGSYFEMALYDKNQKIISYTKFDESFIPQIKKYRWWLNCGYAVAFIPHTRKIIRLHRLILGTPKNMDTDHINNDRLDNRLQNLRFATNGDNQANKNKLSKKNQYKGVYPYNGKWVVKIQHRKILYHIGTFLMEKQAALAYNLKAKEFYGEFAKLNVIP